MANLCNYIYYDDETFFYDKIPFSEYLQEVKDCLKLPASWREVNDTHNTDDRRMFLCAFHTDSNIFETVKLSRYAFQELTNLLFIKYYVYNRTIPIEKL